MLTRRRFVRAGALLEGDDRDRLARDHAAPRRAGHGLHPEPARGRARVGDGPVGGRSRRASRLSSSTPRVPPGPSAARTGPVVTLSRSLITPVPDLLARPRSAPQGLRGVHRPRRERRQDRQPGDRRRDPAAARGARPAARLRQISPPSSSNPRWPDAGRGATTLLMRVWAPARAAATRDAALLEAMLARRRPRRTARALGLALLHREAPGGRARSRRGGASNPTSSSTG